MTTKPIATTPWYYYDCTSETFRLADTHEFGCCADGIKEVFEIPIVRRRWRHRISHVRYRTRQPAFNWMQLRAFADPAPGRLLVKVHGSGTQVSCGASDQAHTFALTCIMSDLWRARLAGYCTLYMELWYNNEPLPDHLPGG